MNIEIETFEHGVTSVLTSGKASANRYIGAYSERNIQIISGKDRIIETCIRINMAIDVYEYGRGGKCV